MPRSHLTLAALATAAVPGFDPVQARAFSTGRHGDFFTAIVTDAENRELIVRAPNSQAAEDQLVAEKYALGAMTAGIRSQLPFEVPTAVGRATLGKTFGLVFDYIPGDLVNLADLTAQPALLVSTGEALASIHSLPTGFVVDAGLPNLSASNVQLQVRNLVSQAVSTKLVPETLANRWRDAVDSEAMWQFEPTVIHGSFSADVLVAGLDSLSGVLGWSALRVADPAFDLHWVMNLPTESQNQIFESYQGIRLSLMDPSLRNRAAMHSELELVRWLLHGLETKDSAIVDDAVQMFDRLVDSVNANDTNPVQAAMSPVLTVTEVVDLLDETPGDSYPGRSQGLEPVTDDQASRNSASE